MCGRSACTLAPDEICKACSVNKVGQIFTAPIWQDHPGTNTYTPSTNIAPSTFCPVMIRRSMLSGKGLKRSVDDEKKENLDDFIIQPMMWGLIPSFYKGDNANGHGYKTSNCRLEGLESKKLFKPSMNKGQRCVVLFDGFYEWQTTKGDKKKQPYFIHASQPNGIEIWNRDSWQNRNLWSDTDGWLGPRILKLAGLFSHWTSTEGEEIFSFSVLTMEAGDSFSWLHHRIPAILETQDDIEAWLDNENLDYKSLLASFSKDPKVEWYPVSTLVNKATNKDLACMQPITLEKKKSSTSESKFMSSWLKSDKKIDSDKK